MKHVNLKSTLKCLLPIIALSVSCSSLWAPDFSIDTTSPQKNYRVKLMGKGESITSTVQQVKLVALKGDSIVLNDDKFYREEVDHPFLKEYPVHEWLNDSILRFGKKHASTLARDEIVILNGIGEHLDILKVEYGNGEKFIVFDLAPGGKVRLQVTPYSGRGQHPNPNVSYNAYSNGRLFADNVQGWRPLGGSEGAFEILLEIGRSQAEAKSNDSFKASGD